MQFITNDLSQLGIDKAKLLTKANTLEVRAIHFIPSFLHYLLLFVKRRLTHAATQSFKNNNVVSGDWTTHALM